MAVVLNPNLRGNSAASWQDRVDQSAAQKRQLVAGLTYTSQTSPLTTSHTYNNGVLFDVDSDGDTDLLIAAKNNGAATEFRYLERTGSGITAGDFTERTGASNPVAEVATALSGDTVTIFEPMLGDVDGDGDVDLMLRGGSTIRYFENTGSEVYVEQVGVNNIANAISLPGSATATNSQANFLDLNGDGLPDFAFTLSRGQISWSKNTGTANSPSFSDDVVIGDVSSDYLRAGFFIDFDGDGDKDVVGQGDYSGSSTGIRAEVNSAGSGADPNYSASRVTYTGSISHPVNQPSFGFIQGDLDCDGRNDVWLEQHGSGSTLFTSSVSNTCAPAASPSAMPTVSSSPSATASTTVTSSVSATASSIATPSVSVTASSMATPSVSVTTSSTVTPSVSATASSTVTPSVSATSSGTATSSVSATVSPTAASSVSATASGTVTSSATATVSPTSTSSVSATVSGTATSSVSTTVSPTSTASVSVTASGAATSSVSATVSPTAASSVSATASGVATPSVGATVSPAATSTASASVSATQTAVVTVSGSAIPSYTSNATPSVTVSSTAVVSPSASSAPSASVTPSLLPNVFAALSSDDDISSSTIGGIIGSILLVAAVVVAAVMISRYNRKRPTTPTPVRDGAIYSGGADPGSGEFAHTNPNLVDESVAVRSG